MEVIGRYSKTFYPWGRLSRLNKSLENMIPRTDSKVRAPRVHRLDNRLSAEAVATIIAEYETGTPSTVLGKQYGTSGAAIVRLLRDYGIEIRNKRLTPAQLEEAERLYLTGLSLVSVGEVMGIKSATIYVNLKRAGVQMRPCSMPRHPGDAAPQAPSPTG